MTPKSHTAALCMVMAFGLVVSGGVARADPPQGEQKTTDSMMMRMQELDTRITALADQMNTSTGEARSAAIVALLNAIVEQHKTMRPRMMMMMMDMGRGAAAPGSMKPEASKPMCSMEKPSAPAAPPASVDDPPAHDHSAN